MRWGIPPHGVCYALSSLASLIHPNQPGWLCALYTSLGYYALLDVFLGRKFKHDIHHQVFYNSAETLALSFAPWLWAMRRRASSEI